MFISKKKYNALLAELQKLNNPPNENPFIRSELRVEEYCSSLIFNIDEEVPTLYVQKELSRLLADELLKEGIIIFEKDFNENHTVEFIASIRVIRKRGTIK